MFVFMHASVMYAPDDMIIQRLDISTYTDDYKKCVNTCASINIKN